MRIGVVQLRSTDDVWKNLLQVQSFISEAEAQKCELVCFPENVFYRGPNFNDIPIEDRPLFRLDEHKDLLQYNEYSKALKETLQSCELIVSLGSVREHIEMDSPLKPSNSHWIVKKGEPIVSYSKIHLFHFGESYQESDDFIRGRKPRVVSFNGFNLGLSICYDLRFPELFRWMTLEKSAQVLLIPAAFAYETGMYHWQALLRARAIENQCYVLASTQWGDHLGKCGRQLSCYGHAAIYDPWGEAIVEAGDEGDALLVADLDPKRLQTIRDSLPALKHSIFRLYYEAGSR